MDKASPTDSDFGASLGLALTGLDITDFITESIASNESFEITKPAEPTFKHFSRLATELRIKIWTSTLNECAVAFIPGGGRAPAILSVNQESREVALKHYTLHELLVPTNVYAFPSSSIKPTKFGFFFNPALNIVQPSVHERDIFTYNEDEVVNSDYFTRPEDLRYRGAPGIKGLLIAEKTCKEALTATQKIVFDLGRLATYEVYIRRELVPAPSLISPFLDKFWLCLHRVCPNLKEIRMEVKTYGPKEKAHFEKFKQSMVESIKKKINKGDELHAWEKLNDGKDVLTLFSWKDRKYM